MLFALILYIVCAKPILQYVEQTAQQISDAALYQQAVLKTDTENNVISVEPFDSKYIPETKYGGESEDSNALYIPYVISENTLKGGHISEYKQRQIQQQVEQQNHVPDDAQLKPMEQ